MATSQTTLLKKQCNGTQSVENLNDSAEQMLTTISRNNDNCKVHVTTTLETIWQKCIYCPTESFTTSVDFIKHLRDRHCSKEGGSYVCRYGFNGVCPSLPLDGVSDFDYDAHVTKYHVSQYVREMQPEWSVFSAAQNLPAVLNDPCRGKQQNLFTKKWGDSFIEKSGIPSTSRLPEVTISDFDKYIQKIGKRYRRHERISAQPNVTDNSDIISNSQLSFIYESDLNHIPEIFLKEPLELNEPPNFSSVFPGIENTAREKTKQTGRLLQEQLSHYLDIVEVKIAHQVSQKSGAFFRAMTSQHTIMAEMEKAIHKVRELRSFLRSLHASVVEDSFLIMRFAQCKQNFEETIDKLCLMSTVHKTQPMLQLLMGTQDYVAALDLISTTQEILSQELIGIHCFKHLPMQLSEMEKLIDKVLTTEFERYATNDLNRPLGDVLKETDSACAEEDKLVSILMGLLRKKNFSFINAYKEEAISSIRAIIKQLVIEIISFSDVEICLTGAGEESQSLTIPEWISLLEKATIALLTVLQRIKLAVAIMRQTADAAAGHCIEISSSTDIEEPAVSLIDSDAFLTAPDNSMVQEKLQDLLISVCNYCHERCANLVSSKSLERNIATQDEVKQLQIIVDDFCDGCESICGTKSVPLKVAVKVQASRFANRFHSDRKQKLSLLLDSERWRQVEIPSEFQKLIENISNGDFTTSNTINVLPNCNESFPNNNILQNVAANPVLLVEGKAYTLVSVALILVQILCEYGRCAQSLPLVACYMSRNVVDLLRTFNSRSCQLIIGAGAMRIAGLKTITSTNLALVSRALQLIVWIIPKIKRHFEIIDKNAVANYEAIEKDFHSHIREIENKIHGIVTERISIQLEQWNARPPVPSQSFRNISKHLVKLYEAIASILPEEQIHVIYKIVHRNFKDKLRKQLLKLNVVNNGGPQHGVVTSELTFYMETLITLKALNEFDTKENLLDTIWTF